MQISWAKIGEHDEEGRESSQTRGQGSVSSKSDVAGKLSRSNLGPMIYCRGVVR